MNVSPSRWQGQGPRVGLPTLVTLAAGLALGWSSSGSRPTALLAAGGDRWEESVVTTGATYVRYNEGSKVQVAQDAVYYLDYRAGKLMGMIPSLRQTPAGSTIIESFAERDLVSDFKIDLDTAPRPHFLMTTGSISSGSSQAFGDGWAALFVVETTTRQVAAYKIQQKMVGTASQVRMDLLEVKPFAREAHSRPLTASQPGGMTTPPPTAGPMIWGSPGL